MSRRNHEQERYWLNVRLDPELDADLILWLQGQSQGRRSEAVREAIRRGLGMTVSEQPSIDLETIRQVFADELARSLAGLRFQPQPSQEQQNSVEAEAKYGAKLDRMLGGLTASRSNSDMSD